MDVGREGTRVDFALLAEETMLVEVATRVGRELAPGYPARDRGEEGVDPVFDRLAEARLLGLSAPVEAHGQGASTLANGLVCETLARSDWTAAALVAGSPTWLKLIHHHADERLHDWLPLLAGGKRRLAFSVTEQQSGSDTSNIRTTAELVGGEWVLNGEKNSTSWPSADAAIVLAKVPGRGPGLFFTPLAAPGVSISLLEDVGNRAVGRSIVSYDQVRIPDYHAIGTPGEGLRAIMSMFTIQKVLLSLMCVGIAEAALSDAVDWARDRETFGAPLATRQAIAHPLVTGLAELEMGRLLCLKALWLHDQGAPFRKEASMVKALIPRRAVELCHESMLVLGHSSYSAEHRAQLRLRDVISAEFAEGGEHIQKNLLAREVLGSLPG